MSQQHIIGADWLQSIEENFTELYDAGAGNTASTSAKGPVELATSAEALAGSDTARAVTPAAFASALGYLDALSFAGRNGAGACTLTGVKVGDVVLSVTGVVSGTVGDKGASFETAITVADQIQQSSASDLSSNVYLALIWRKS